MEMEITVPEARELINEISEQPGSLFDMIRVNVQATVGRFLSARMDTEMNHFLGRGRYERSEGENNHCNGSHSRNFTLKGLGEVGVKVPRDRKGKFSTRVIPRSIQCEDAIREELCVTFLDEVSTRALSMMSERFIGRGIFPAEVSEAGKELTHAVEECGGSGIYHRKNINTFFERGSAPAFCLQHT